jgi:hypothetical protein
MNPELREKAGINERVIRISVGIEDVNDLIEDLDHALSSTVETPKAHHQQSTGKVRHGVTG